jgi:acyl-CoA synthetase (AMP-forming)/AMP-acid ligase II
MSTLGKIQDLRQQITYNAAEHGDHVWLVSPETDLEITFREAAERVELIAANLKAFGLNQGDRVAIASQNCIGCCLTFMGIIYGGFVAVPLNLVAGTKTIRYIVNHSEAKLIFVADHCSKDINDALQGISKDIRCVPLQYEAGPNWNEVVLNSDIGHTGANLTADAISLLMYTSGTTGNPKGVMLNHANLLAAGRFISSGHTITQHDRGLCILPIFHINGLCVTVMGSTVSSSTLIMPYRFSVSVFWEIINKYKCSWFSAVPTQFSYILNQPETRKDLSHLRFARSASAPLSPNIHRDFEERFKVPIIETMGLTETGSQISTNPMPPAERKIGSPGKAYGNEIMIGDKYQLSVASGVIGEILVRGANVMQGYFKQPQETAKTITELGWLRTGDLGFMDEDGFIFVSGRIKELIIKGGENIAPREIDEALLEHITILEAAAFAVPCPDYGERVEACIRFKETLNAPLDVLYDHCKERLGSFKSPDVIHILEDLPKGPSGKVQRLKLLELIYPTCA